MLGTVRGRRCIPTQPQLKRTRNPATRALGSRSSAQSLVCCAHLSALHITVRPQLEILQQYTMYTTPHSAHYGNHGTPYASNPPPAFGASGRHGGGAYQQGPPAGGDPQLWQWFSAVDADRSGSISVKELQAALVNGQGARIKDNIFAKVILCYRKLD